MPALRLRLLGVPVEIRVSFLLLAVLVGLPTHLEPELMLAWIAIATVAVLAHEAGHAAAFVAVGDRPQITLHGGGGHTVGGDHGVVRMIGISVAGPATGLALGAAVLIVAPSFPSDPVSRLLVTDALLATIGLSLLNLLPIASFDGRAILDGLIAATTGRPAGILGSMAAALAIGALLLVSLSYGRIEIAFFLGFVVAFQSSPLSRLFGMPRGAGSAARMLYLGHLPTALAAIEADLERNPRDVSAMLVRASTLTALTRYGEAESEYNTVLAFQPGNVGALAGRSVARRRQGNGRSANEDLDASLATPAMEPDAMGAQFFALYHDRQYEHALRLVRSALRRPGLSRPHEDFLRALGATSEGALGRPEVALREIGTLIARRPNDHGLHELAALALVQLGRLDEALGRINRALAGAPSHPELLETQGIIERFAGRPERALDSLLRAATERPYLPRARAELSACFTQLGRHQEAAAALDSLASWTADDPHVQYARACIDAAAGRHAEAEARLARVAAVEPSRALLARFDPLLVPLSAPLAAPLRPAAAVAGWQA